MFKSLNRSISTPIAIIIIIVLAVIVGGGILVYQYKPTPKGLGVTPTPQNGTADWKTYRNEKYGFEFQYPTIWKVDEDTHFPFFQLQEVKGGRVVAVAGGISIINKATLSLIDSPYIKMFNSDSRCPIAAGSRNLPSGDNYEEYMYCLTGEDVQISAGTWRGAVECSTEEWYGMKVDPSSCSHEFWIDTKNFFFVVQFNFFQPIKQGSDEAELFEKFLKGFSFFTPNG